MFRNISARHNGRTTKHPMYTMSCVLILLFFRLKCLLLSLSIRYPPSFILHSNILNLFVNFSPCIPITFQFGPSRSLSELYGFLRNSCSAKQGCRTFCAPTLKSTPSQLRQTVLPQGSSALMRRTAIWEQG